MKLKLTKHKIDTHDFELSKRLELEERARINWANDKDQQVSRPSKGDTRLVSSLYVFESSGLIVSVS